ncbi:nitroreductase family protein [Planctomycetota bacterium]
MTEDPLDFLTLVRQRQSVRGYRPDPVNSEAIYRCIEAARLAPSACNSQPWTFIVVDDIKLKNEIADLAADRVLSLNHFTKQAPVIVVIVVEPANLSARFGAALKARPLPWIDLGIVAEHFCLQATAEGLGTCLLGWFKEKPIKRLLGIPANKRIGLLITLGHPTDDRIRTKQRKDVATITRHNAYQPQEGSTHGKEK